MVESKTAAASYLDRLNAAAKKSATIACAGIDPSPEAVELLLGHQDLGSDRRSRAARIERLCGMIIEAVRDFVPIVKFQVAWFETAGPQGIRALERSVAYARAAGLLVVIDAKRGDVPHSAQAYASAWLGTAAESGICGDALTVNGAIGHDSLIAMNEIAVNRNSYLYALVHTSNPGAKELQSARIVSQSEHDRWWQLVARSVDEIGCGAVIGATVDHTVLVKARTLMPKASLLIPGVGAQGGSLPRDEADLRADSAPPSVVPASRSLLPQQPSDTAEFRMIVGRKAQEFAKNVDQPLRYDRIVT